MNVTTTPNLRITLIGLGKMGTAIAMRLLQTGMQLTVFNRTAQKSEALRSQGAIVADSLHAAVVDADIVITCLFDDQSILETVASPSGFMTHLKSGAIHLNTSTILPETSKTLTQLHHDHNSIYVAANVLGVPKVALAGQIVSFVSGDEQAIEICTPIIKTYSKEIINVGKDPYKANVLKICANYLLATTIECMGELYAFAEKSDVDTNILHTFFDTVFLHPSFKLYANKIKHRDFDEVNFSLAGGLKDLTLFQKAFSKINVSSGLADLIQNKFEIAKSLGLENKDWSAVTEVSRTKKI